MPETARNENTMARRSDEARLRLFRDVAMRLAASSALAGLRRAAIEIAEPTKGEIRVTMDQPADEALRAFVVDLREFVNPKHDLYLPGIVAVLRGRVPSDRAVLLDRVAPQFRRLYEASRWTAKMTRQPDAYNLSPWESFDLWVYAHYIHLDVEKIERFQRMHPIVQGFVRMAAFDFMAQLVLLVGAVAAEIDDEV
jgi:hypothetical protein